MRDQLMKNHKENLASTQKLDASVLIPSMPGGKDGEGIESFSTLCNPKVGPISNFFCRGYHNLQKYTIDDPTGSTYIRKQMEIHKDQK